MRVIQEDIGLKLAEKLNLVLNPKQVEIVNSVFENSVTVVKATRRGGKSLMAALCASAVLLSPNARVNILAPTLSLTDIIYNNVISIMVDQMHLTKQVLNKKDHILAFEWGCELKAASFNNIKQVLGVSNDLFIIDEAAIIDAESLEFLFQDIFPTLIQHGGHLLIISTPRGLNWFHDIYKKAETEPGWKAISYTIDEVDHLSLDAIQTLKTQYFSANMEIYWRQEFEVEFTVFEGKIYEFTPKLWDKELPDDIEFYIGLDPGASHPFGVVVVGISPSVGVFLIDGYIGIGSTAEHAERIQEYIDKYDPVQIYIDYAAAQTTHDLAYEHDISCRNAIKSIEEGINFIRGLKDNLYILDNPFREDFLRQWSLYRTKKGVIVKRNDDFVDAFRYGVYTAYVDFFVGQLPYLKEVSIGDLDD